VTEIVVKEAFSNERGSAKGSVNARPRNVSVSVNAIENEIVNNVSPRGSNRTESRAIGPVGVLLDILVVSDSNLVSLRTLQSLDRTVRGSLSSSE